VNLNVVSSLSSTCECVGYLKASRSLYSIKRTTVKVAPESVKPYFTLYTLIKASVMSSTNGVCAFLRLSSARKAKNLAAALELKGLLCSARSTFII